MILMLAVLCSGSFLPAQASQWVWMGGASVAAGQNGTYGTKGVAAPGNVPGARTGALGWTDADGNFWLFGGNAWAGLGTSSIHYNDLWKFDPANKEWAWMGGTNTQQFGAYGTMGVPAAANVPGSRETGVSWTDESGNLWLFGGWGYDANGWFGTLNDLWKFDPASGMWTWVSGSSTLPNNNLGCRPGVYGTMGTPAPDNVPGGRMEAVGWTASDGTLWLFGGGGCDWNDGQGILNDLWKFDPATSEWTWMGGSNTGAAPGVYGTLGTPGVGNVPGGRWTSVAWTDAQGNFWLFGGEGFDSVQARGYLNDLWEFTPSTNEWAWMSGSSTLGTDNCYQPPNVECARSGVYGTLGQPAPLNVPSGRDGAMGSVDGAGNLLLFGGANNPAGLVNTYNDLWQFNPATKQWAWISGSDKVDCAAKDNSGNCIMAGEYGVYGTLEVPAAANMPGSRTAALTWADKDGNFWMFGGDGLDSIELSYMNDLWSYQAPAPPPPPPPTFTFGANSSSLTVKAGGQGSLTLTVTPANGFDAQVSFACSGLPAGATCSFNPANITPAGSAASTQLTIAASSTALVVPERVPFLPVAALPALGCLLFGTKRRFRFRASFLLALSGGIALFSSCSSVSGMGSSPPPPPQPTVATVTIAATSGALQQTATITLTINH
jgi:N-acetylneuraminic acid mutarotase